MKFYFSNTSLLWFHLIIGLIKLIMSTETDSVINVVGISGETVQLPCNFSLNKIRDIELILWYKGQGTGKPIFTLDTRITSLFKHLSGSSRKTGLYNSKTNNLVSSLYNKLQQNPIISIGTKRAEPRLTFNLTGQFAYLQIKQVLITDQSEYKCRVDYKQSRSDYYQVNLTVIVPPKTLKILHSKNNEGLESLIGPFNEKESLVLTCQSKLAQPAPLLNWYRNGEPLEPLSVLSLNNQTKLDFDSLTTTELYSYGYSITSDENSSNQQPNSFSNIQIKQQQINNEIVESELTILSLNRDFLLNRIECRSSLLNEGQIFKRDYQKVSVTLDLNLSPLSVRIRTKKEENELKAGTSVELNCEVFGSRPPPRITWHLVTQSNQVVDLVLKRHLSSSNINDHQTGNVQVLDLENLEEIISYQNTLPSKDQEYFKPNNQNRNSSKNILRSTLPSKLVSKQPILYTIDYPLLSQDGNTSSSILKIKLNQQMHLNQLICKAINFEVQRDSELEDRLLLNILYAPLVRIELGSNIQENSIKESSDVYFECKINANPYVNEIQWFFNGNLLASNYNGILIANHSLVLQSVKRENKGFYSCAAINSQGKTHSQNFFLRVLYAPVCKEPQRSTYGLALSETAKILCQVDADPTPSAFLWFFNNSNEKIPLRNYTVNQTSSILTYQPKSRYSYGILHCYGRNEIGSQIKPCNFQLVHASLPEVVKNCEILAASSKTAKNYLQQNTNFLKLVLATKSQNLNEKTNILNDLNNEEIIKFNELNNEQYNNLSLSNKYLINNSKSNKKSSSFLHKESKNSLNDLSKLFNRSILSNETKNDKQDLTLYNNLQLNLNLLENAMFIKCLPGFNGGLKQIFFLEVYDLVEQQLYLNITSVENPVFLLTELKPNTKFSLSIYAANVKGRSSSINLNFHTFQPQVSNAKKQASEESIYGSFSGILIFIGLSSFLIFTLLILFFRSKNSRSSSLNRSNSSLQLSSNNQPQFKDAHLNSLKTSLSGRLYNDDIQNTIPENYDFVKDAYSSTNNLGIVQSEICFKQPEVTYAELSILSPNGNFSNGTNITNQTTNSNDFVGFDFQLINHNHLALNSNSSLPIGISMPLHSIPDNDFSTYRPSLTNNSFISPIANPLRIHYSTSLVNSPSIPIHSKITNFENTNRTISSASTATDTTRQLLDHADCDLQSSQ